MTRNPKVRAQSAPWSAHVELLIAQGDAVGVQVQMQKVEMGAKVEPTLSLSMEAAQTLMDDLWKSGLRPTEGAGSAGALRAVERHLEDMRALVFPGGKP